MEGSKSIVVENELISAISGAPIECRHHLIFGNGRRVYAEEDGIWIPLTNAEHNMGDLLHRIHDNPMAEELSKIAGQLAWEGEYYRNASTKGQFAARKAFRQHYGKSYL